MSFLKEFGCVSEYSRRQVMAVSRTINWYNDLLRSFPVQQISMVEIHHGRVRWSNCLDSKLGSSNLLRMKILCTSSNRGISLFTILRVWIILRLFLLCSGVIHPARKGFHPSALQTAKAKANSVINQNAFLVHEVSFQLPDKGGFLARRSPF